MRSKSTNKAVPLLMTICLVLMLLPRIVMPIIAATPGTYNAGDIAVINRIIANNGLNWTTADPADGSYVPGGWTGIVWSDDNTDKRILELDVSGKNLAGTLDVAGLTDLNLLNCRDNRLTALA